MSPRTDPSVALVSVGIPVRNGERHLAAALDSALAQDHPHVEVVVSDNASTDGTESICRRYAEKDRRIRYRRNRENLGAVANFGIVLREARGRFFTWLAADDLLSSPSYLTKTVGFLEANPDVVLCASDIDVLDLSGPGERLAWRFPEIGPGRSEREIRALFFTWPQLPAVAFSVYGTFRREALDGVSFAGRTHRGQPVVFHLEYPILVPVSARGRIVALPEVLRTYRRSYDSAYHRERDRLSGLDYAWLGLQTKWFLLRSAWQLPVARTERISLVVRALGNFLVLGLRTERGEARRLRAVVEERRRAILSLRAAIEERREIVRRHGWGPVATLEPAAPSIPRTEPGDRPAPTWWPGWLEPLRDAVEALRIGDAFSAPSERRRAEWRQEVTDLYVLRRTCAEHLEEIERLTREAEGYRVILESAGRRAPGATATGEPSAR